jgi:hypothetical protein
MIAYGNPYRTGDVSDDDVSIIAIVLTSLFEHTFLTN